MSTFNEIEMTTPYGDTDNVLELNIDSSSDAYILQNVIKLPSTYTFSIWYRTENNSQITFNVLGESETVNSTTSWNKYVKTVTVETLDKTSIYIMPSVGVNSYFYEGYLAEGITDTSWLPAPEDIEGEIGSVRSELRQTAESILLKVSDSNGRITTLETNLEGITTEISDAKGSSTTLQARLEGIDTSVVNAETSAKSFATQEAERIQSVVQNNIDNVESNINQRADNIELSVAQKENVPVTAVRYIRDWLNGCSVNEKNVLDLRKYFAEDQTSKNMTITQLAYNSISIHCENVPSYAYFTIDLSEIVKVGKKYTIYFNATGTNTNITIDEATDADFSDITIISASSVTIREGYHYRLKIYGNKSDTGQTTTYDNVYTNVKLIETTNVSVVETQVTNVQACYYNPVSIDGYDTADYADEMIVENGEITLVNPTTITIDSTANCKLLIGKYVYLSNKKAYYRVPSDATVSYETGVTSKTWKLSTAYKLAPEELYNNRWVECMVVSGDINLALGLSPTCKDADLNTIETSNLDYYTDEMILDEDIRRYVDSGVESCLELDLGAIYYDIDYIQIWHYYDDNRVYNHKLQISTDGVSWVTIYDSEIAGGYAETSGGKAYYLNNASVSENISSLTISVDSIEGRVQNVEGQYSSIQQQVESIQSTIGGEDSSDGLLKTIKDLDDQLAALQGTVDTNKADVSESITQIQQTISEITSRVATVEGDTTKITEIEQNANGWKAVVAQVGLGEEAGTIATSTNIGIDGLSVVNMTPESEQYGQATLITPEGLQGYINYNDDNLREKVFWVEGDTTKTTRVLCKKGWDTDTIKMTTTDLSSSGGTKGVVFIKSGGTS